MNGDDIPQNPLNSQQQWQQQMAGLPPEMTQGQMQQIGQMHEQTAELERLRRRVMELEGALVYVRNFLPAPLKAHAESVLWPKE